MRTFLMLLMATLVACEGPMGPEGPPGPEGEAGPGTRLVLNATIDGSGSGYVDLPAEAGTLSSPPTISCYISDDGSTWLIVALSSGGGSTCGWGEDPDGSLWVGVINAPPGWRLRVVVVY